jgi:hypothetical protein
MYPSEEQYLAQLSHYLARGNLRDFEKLVKRLDDQGILVDLTRITNIEDKISKLFIDNLQTGINIDEIFHILRFTNNFQLFANKSDETQGQISEDAQKLIMNLQALFGDLSSGFINYIINSLPESLSVFISSNTGRFLPFDSKFSLEETIDSIYSFVDNTYSSYGLRSRKIGTFKNYYQKYKRKREKYNENYYAFEIDKADFPDQSNQSLFIIFSDVVQSSEMHLVYAPLLEIVKTKFDQGKYAYEFPIVSMVTNGGIGPEGKGFAYLTPKGEVIEVCSDAKQNKAYIIEYKQYLKSIFLEKLAQYMQFWPDKLKVETIDFFNTNIHTKMVGLHDIESLFEREINTYLQKVKNLITQEFLNFLEKSLHEILIPVQMEDQFKVRMDLIRDNKISESEVAKMASLGDVSHFDILNQRIFFLNLINNMKRILRQKKLLA